MLGVTAAIAAGLSLGGGMAAAAPPKCTAVLKPGFGCLAFNNKTGNPAVRSIRIDGTCIPNLVPGKTRYVTGYAMGGYSEVNWIWHTGSNCNGGTETDRGGIGGWSNLDKKTSYFTVTLINV
ncbi:hypothetical protein [Amycolatopsis sp. NPDC059657]|uniref:hypothetical protein n=1 Tax=Amycolatopsis sp. NPDC059657 TaxID=3346899 RepID=UPI003670C3F1